MDFFEGIKHAIGPAGGALEALPPGRWDPVSFTPDRDQPGQKIGRVTAHGVGMTAGTAWGFWTFTRDDGTVHTFWITSRGAGSAQLRLAPGPHDHNNMGAPLPGGRVVVHPIFVPFPPQAKISVAALYDEGGKTAEYRFDGRNWP